MTVDLVCHGVPSPGIWKNYKSLVSSKKSISSVNFRHKKWGWRNFHLSISFSDGSSSDIKRSRDPYMQAFLKDYALRPSCYQCINKGIKRSSDITLADAWGAEDFSNSGDDNQGLTLVLVNTPIGRKLLESAQNLTCEMVDFDDALKHNRYIMISAPRPTDRDNFWKDICSSDDIEITAKKYCKKSVKEYTQGIRNRLKLGTRIRALFH